VGIDVSEEYNVLVFSVDYKVALDSKQFECSIDCQPVCSSVCPSVCIHTIQRGPKSCIHNVQPPISLTTLLFDKAVLADLSLHHILSEYSSKH
jgi:hypothetical protein